MPGHQSVFSPSYSKARGRAASKDTELENTYLMLLKETSPNEKSITRDLGRYIWPPDSSPAVF